MYHIPTRELISPPTKYLASNQYNRFSGTQKKTRNEFCVTCNYADNYLAFDGLKLHSNIHNGNSPREKA